MKNQPQVQVNKNKLNVVEETNLDDMAQALENSMKETSVPPVVTSQSFNQDGLNGTDEISEDFINLDEDSEDEDEDEDEDIDIKTRSFPNAIDGTSDSFVSKTEAEKNAQEKIDRPMQSKLQSIPVDEIVKFCSDAIADIVQYEKDRSEVNAEITAIREKLEAQGISKKALAMAIAVSKMSEDQMDGFDLAYTILRKSIARPIQDSLFD